MRKTRAIIHLDHLIHNLKTIATLCPNSRICLAVKADAYGHGALRIAQSALQAGVYALGVATADEALELRAGGIQSPILLFGIAAPDELPDLIRADIELFCTDQAFMADIAKCASNLGQTAAIHLKIDTGMGRIGCQPSAALDLARLASADFRNSLRLAGVCTHLPRSEESDKSYTKRQIAEFAQIVGDMRKAGIKPGLVHAANSGGICLHSGSHFDMVRPGIMAYGYPPGEAGFEQIDLKPVMELRSTISFVKRVPAGTGLSYGHRYSTTDDSWIATVPIGYGDGLPRAASGKLNFQVLDAQGNPTIIAQQVGTICMDQCLVRLGPGSQPCPAKRWDEVVVFGPKPCPESAQSLAKTVGSIPYEICCGINKRVPRTYP